jgi:uncharacterized repeat protein (TIGR01451 family)
MNLKPKRTLYGTVLGLILLLLVLPSHADAAPPRQTSFDPAISVVGELAPNAMGLPGEWITWVITVVNSGGAPGRDIVVSDVLRNELRIDSVEANFGAFTINEQSVEFTIPVLNPGESVEMRINTTVLRGPADGVLINQVLLSGTGPNGAITDNAVAEVPVPTTLPATGYPPEQDLPGYGEPSALVVGLGSLAMVVLAALVIWWRGR